MNEEDGEAAELVAAIRRRRAEFEAAGAAAEGLRTLPGDTVATLRELGLFWLKTPAELGGTPMGAESFCTVIEELAYIDVSTAWTAMIGAGCCGLAGGWLPDAGAREVFATGAPLPVIAGQLSPRGTGTQVAGGYQVTGRWGFSSGILHADWLIGAFPPPSDADGAGLGQMIVFTIPREHAEVIDTWHVAGLQGTGSLDWKVTDVFVPADRTYPLGFYQLGFPAVRGGELFRLGMPAFVSNEVPPLCIGLARRALDDMTQLATQTARFPGGPTVAERAVFHKELGRAEVRLRAARLVHRDAMAACWASAVSGAGPTVAEQLAVTSASVFAVETCAEIVTDLFRYGGGRVLALSSPMQRHLRDVLAARQHVALSEEHYEAAGRYRIEQAGNLMKGR
jgi:alkylation response protein AidB-like acyl-CoA dehydrogenase